MMDNVDPFASFFGDFGFPFGGGEQNHETPRGANIVMDVLVTLEDLYSGNKSTRYFTEIGNFILCFL